MGDCESEELWPAFKERWGPTITGLRADKSQFQTLCGVRARDRHAALLKYIFKAINESDEFQNLEQKNDQEAVWTSVQHMIDCERAAWSLDYFVFYRLITEKYVLYEFNTIMLALLTENRVQPESLRLMPVPSLIPGDYPQSIHHAIDMFGEHGKGADSFSRINAFLISVNNTLKPSINRKVKNHTEIILEAEPLENFLGGYHATFDWEHRISQFLQTFFGITAQEAEQTIHDLISIYNEAQPPDAHAGHTLQICIPRTALERFVYPCVAWGHPVGVWRDADERLHIMPVFRHQLFEGSRFWSPDSVRTQVPPDWTPVPLATFLRSPDLGHLQSRIVAHPSLFLEHGAVTNVFHANPRFDAAQFRLRMLLRLRPLLERALAERRALFFGH